MNIFFVAVLGFAAATQSPEFLLVFSSPGPVQPNGQLTGNGLRMGYVFGKYLLSRYAEFFPKKFDHKKSYIVASATDSCKQYAQAVMLGVYDLGSLSDPVDVKPEFFRPPWKGVDVEDAFPTPLPHGYQPIPVHSFNAEDNYVFEAYDERVCPLLPRRLKPGDKGKEVEGLAVAFLPQLRKHFDYDTLIKYSSHKDLYVYWRHFQTQKYLGVELVPAPLLQKLETLCGLSLLATFAEPASLKFSLSPLLRLFQSFIDEAAEGMAGKKPDYRKFVLAVGSDVNIFLLQALLGKTSYECLLSRAKTEKAEGDCVGLPTFGASFSIELRHSTEGKPTATFLFNGKHQAFCAQHKEACPLKEFNERIESMALPQAGLMTKFCRAAPADHNTYLLVMVIFNAALIAFLLYFLFKLKG